MHFSVSQFIRTLSIGLLSHSKTNQIRSHVFPRFCGIPCSRLTSVICKSWGLVVTSGKRADTYVDDLMICSPTKQACKVDTVALLKYLADQGHKASLAKLQFVQKSVTFLGHEISSSGKTLSSKRVEAILKIPKPRTKRQLMSLLGMTAYCRQWICDYVSLEAPLLYVMYVVC